MDLMIEPKEKEQAFFEIMRKFKLPSYRPISELTPHVCEAKLSLGNYQNELKSRASTSTCPN
jgi:hypothetical protein